MIVIKYKAGKEIKKYTTTERKLDVVMANLPFDCIAKNILQVKRYEGDENYNGKYVSACKRLNRGY